MLEFSAETVVKEVDTVDLKIPMHRFDLFGLDKIQNRKGKTDILTGNLISYFNPMNLTYIWFHSYVLYIF